MKIYFITPRTEKSRLISDYQKSNQTYNKPFSVFQRILVVKYTSYQTLNV